MTDLNQLFVDSGLQDTWRELKKFERYTKNVRRTEKLRKEQERLEFLTSGTDYELEIYYNDKSPEFISLEGYENGFKVLETYRKIGFNLNVRKLKLTLNEKKVKVINFKY